MFCAFLAGSPTKFVCHTKEFANYGTFNRYMQEIPADSRNFPWYMTDSVAVLEDLSYSEVVVNVIDLALNWQLFSDVGRPRSFVNVMSANSSLDPEIFWGGGGGGLIVETNCILEYKPPPTIGRM